MATTTCPKPNDPCYLIGPSKPDAPANYSDHFTLDDNLALLQAYGLMPGDTVVLQQIEGSNDDGYIYQDAYFANNIPMAMTDGLTALPVLLPGEYRVCITPADAWERVIVKKKPAPKECLLGLPFLDMLIGVPDAEYSNACPGYEGVTSYAGALDVLIQKMKDWEALVLVTSVTQDANGDYTVNYTNGTSELLDDLNIPVFSCTVNPDGTVNLLIDGVVKIPNIAIGPHTVDTDTTYLFKTNPDGSVTICLADGTPLATTASQTVDTNTFSVPIFNAADGTVTVTYANGDVHTFPTGPHTLDTYGSVVNNPDGTCTWNPPAGSGLLPKTWQGTGNVFVGPAVPPYPHQTVWVKCDTGKVYYWCDPYWVSYDIPSTGVQSVVDGGSNLVNNADGDNPVIRPLIEHGTNTKIDATNRTFLTGETAPRPFDPAVAKNSLSSTKQIWCDASGQIRWQPSITKIASTGSPIFNKDWIADESPLFSATYTASITNTHECPMFVWAHFAVLDVLAGDFGGAWGTLLRVFINVNSAGNVSVLQNPNSHENQNSLTPGSITRENASRYNYRTLGVLAPGDTVAADMTFDVAKFGTMAQDHASLIGQYAVGMLLIGSTAG